MKLFVFIMVCLSPFPASAQVKDSLVVPAQQNSRTTQQPEILSGGFIDFVQNGQMNASARLFRLYIGEPGKFQVPVTVYTGVSGNSFSNNRPADDILLTLINPGTGIFNLNFEGSNRILGSPKKITCLQFQYLAGFRYLTVFNNTSFKNTSFCNLIAGLGFTVVTGAWDKNKPNNMGIFWFNLRALYSDNPSSVMEDFFPVAAVPRLMGWSAGMGIEISQLLNVRIFYFRFLNNRSIRAFTLPWLQLTFNYSLK